MHAELGRTRIVASNRGPMKPRAWRGTARGGWLIFSAIAGRELLTYRLDQLEAGAGSPPASWSHPHRSSQPRSTAAGPGRWSLNDDALGVRMVIRHGLRTARLRVKGRDMSASSAAAACAASFSSLAVVTSFFELQTQLFEQPCRALGALPVKFEFELLDPQLRDARSAPRLSDSSARALAATRLGLPAAPHARPAARQGTAGPMKIVRLRCMKH